MGRASDRAARRSKAAATCGIVVGRSPNEPDLGPSTPRGMSLRTLFITTSLLVSAQVVTAFHGHRQDAAVTYLRPELTTVDVVWQSELRQRPQWRGFLAAHGTWWAEFNTANGMPHRAFGEPIPTVGSDPVSRATQFLQNELAMYPLPMDQLSVSAVYPTQKHTYVHFIQVHNGLPVLTGRVMVKLDLQGRVIAFGLDAYASIGISLNPAQGDAAAIASASAGLTNIGSVVGAPSSAIPRSGAPLGACGRGGYHGEWDACSLGVLGGCQHRPIALPAEPCNAPCPARLGRC